MQACPKTLKYLDIGLRSKIMIFDIFMSIAIFYLCYKLVMFRRRKTREFKEKKREERK